MLLDRSCKRVNHLLLLLLLLLFVLGGVGVVFPLQLMSVFMSNFTYGVLIWLAGQAPSQLTSTNYYKYLFNFGGY